MKKFFTSAWFKCIAVLLSIALVSGGLLAILNDVLYVSAEVRTMRAITKIYGEEKEYSVVLDVDGTDENKKTAYICEDFGTISKIYVIGEKTSGEFDYLFKATGEHGYKNGTVSLWIQVKVSGGEQKIEKVILDGFTKQTLMSKLGSSYYDEFAEDFNGEYFSAKEEKDKTYAPVSGATYSATAANNAVNCVIFWLRGNV